MEHKIEHWADFIAGMDELDRAENALKARTVILNWIEQIEDQEDAQVTINAYDSILVTRVLHQAALAHAKAAKELLRLAVPTFDVPF